MENDIKYWVRGKIKEGVGFTLRTEQQANDQGLGSSVSSCGERRKERNWPLQNKGETRSKIKRHSSRNRDG